MKNNFEQLDAICIPDTKLLNLLCKDLEQIYAICEKKAGFYSGFTKSDKRYPELVMTRNIYFKMAKKYTEYSLTQIGMICNRNHATVLHGLKTIERDIDQFDRIKDLVSEIDIIVFENINMRKKNQMEQAICYLNEIISMSAKLLENYENLKREVLQNETFD